MSVGRGTARAYQFDYDFQMRNHEDHEKNAMEALDNCSVCENLAIPII